MSNQIKHAITLLVINETCSSTENPVKPIGGKKQCLEGAIQSYALAREGFTFDSIEDAKNKTKWETAIENKDIVPFPDIESIEDNSTDPEIIEGRYRDVTTKGPVAGSEYTLNLSVCTYEAAASYENSEYTRIFQITERNELGCEVMEDGKVRGRKLKSFLVGNRVEATTDALPEVPISTKYGSRFFDILKLPFEAIELEGIYGVTLQQESASDTEVKFEVLDLCSGATVEDIDSASFIMYEADGTTDASASFSGPTDGVYTATGTGFADGYTIELDGVVTTNNNYYETGNKLVVTGV